MAVTVKLPTQLRDAAGGATSVSVAGGTVGEALESLYSEHGELRLPLLRLARLRGRVLRRAAIAGSRHHSYLSYVFPAKPAPDA